MKLYYYPGACSLATHITLREAGVPFTLERVDLVTKKTESGKDFTAINPKGYVPALQLDDGEVLTEGVALMQFIADQNPAAGLAPAAGTLERARLNGHLCFISTELHKAFSPLFRKTTSDADRQTTKDTLSRRFAFIEQVLGDGRPYLMGDAFSIADAYLFVVANWAGPTGFGSLERWPHLSALMARVAQRPAVQAALKAEGLIPAA